MNKKGFTLAELLVVVVVLGLIAIVLVPIIQDALNKSKNKINSINIKQVEDAGKIVAEEILYCDINSNTRGVIANNNLSKCDEMQDVLYNEGIILNISNMKTYKYLSDPNDLCTGSIIITADENTFKVSIDASGAKCTSK
mgnify:FL=1